MLYVREREEARVIPRSPNCAVGGMRLLIADIRNCKNRSYGGGGVYEGRGQVILLLIIRDMALHLFRKNS